VSRNASSATGRSFRFCLAIANLFEYHYALVNESSNPGDDMCEMDDPFVERMIERLAAEHSEGAPRVRRYCESGIMKMKEEGVSEEKIYQEMSKRVKGLSPSRG
jgi:hypothetical protein